MGNDSPEAIAKVALLTHLRSDGALRSSALISELAVEKWARRADVVTVGSLMTCFEVKSRADRLTRLEDQLSAYSSVFDRVYAVVATKHMNTVMSRVPEYVGLKELVQVAKGVEARHVRDALPSPELATQASLNLLPVSELAKLIRAHSGRPCGSHNRAALLDAAISIPSEAIRSHLREYLKGKHGASTAAFNAAVSGRRIKVEDLAHLSIWQRSAPFSSAENDVLADWLAALSNDRAFGPVPQDVRDLLAAT
jgi:hypothetical protein